MSTILFILAGVAVIGAMIAFIIRKKKREEADADPWIVPIKLLTEIVLPIAEQRMIDDGFGPDDYVLGIKMCPQYADRWIKVLSKLLSPYRPKGKREWLKKFRFNREDTSEGHQLVSIKTTDGEKFIDNYRNKYCFPGTIFRNLTDGEKRYGSYFR